MFPLGGWQSIHWFTVCRTQLWHITAVHGGNSCVCNRDVGTINFTSGSVIVGHVFPSVWDRSIENQKCELQPQQVCARIPPPPGYHCGCASALWSSWVSLPFKISRYVPRTVIFNPCPVAGTLMCLKNFHETIFIYSNVHFWLFCQKLSVDICVVL